MAFEVQDLTDLIRLTILVRMNLKAKTVRTETIFSILAKMCGAKYCITQKELDLALRDMAEEGLLIRDSGGIRLTPRGITLGFKWQDVFWKSTPVLEIIAGLTDGSITGLVVILSTLLGRINLSVALFSSLLTLTAVMITNFSSFFLGGTTEDYSDLATFRDLLQYSLSDTPDKVQRDKSLMLLNNLASIFQREIKKNNLISAVTCGGTTFGAGIIPIALFYFVAEPWDVILSIGFVLAVIFTFLVYYRAKRGKTRLKITLLETLLIIAIAVVASLLLGQTV